MVKPSLWNQSAAIAAVPKRHAGSRQALPTPNYPWQTGDLNTEELQETGTGMSAQFFACMDAICESCKNTHVMQAY